MKIAFPSREANIDPHFGHCEYFTIVTTDGKSILSQEKLVPPTGCGCKSGISATLAQMDVRLLIGGNMGDGAKNVLNANGIKVISGQSGTVEDVCLAYLNGSLIDNPTTCQDHHSCHNH